jgi:PST family polysaccharide transporter
VVAISVAAVLDTLVYNFGDVYKAQGRPEVLSKLSLVRVCILVPALWWAVTGPGTLIAVAWTVVVVTFVGMVIQIFVARRILQVPFVMILEALRPAAIGGTAMSLAVMGVLTLCADAGPFVKLIVAVATGGITYVGGLWWFQRDVVVTAAYALRQGLTRRL